MTSCPILDHSTPQCHTKQWQTDQADSKRAQWACRFWNTFGVLSGFHPYNSQLTGATIMVTSSHNGIAYLSKERLLQYVLFFCFVFEETNFNSFHFPLSAIFFYSLHPALSFTYPSLLLHFHPHSSPPPPQLLVLWTPSTRRWTVTPAWSAPTNR